MNKKKVEVPASKSTYSPPSEAEIIKQLMELAETQDQVMYLSRDTDYALASRLRAVEVTLEEHKKELQNKYLEIKIYKDVIKMMLDTSRNGY